MPRNFLYIGIAGFLIGVFVQSLLGDFLPSSVWFWTDIAFSGLALVLVAITPKKTFKVLLFIGISILFVSLGIVRSDIASNNVGDPLLESRTGEKVVLTGIVAEAPDERIDNIKLTMRTVSLEEGDEILPVQTTVLVTVQTYQTFSYGDEIEVRGKLKKPEAFETDTGRLFHYDQYLAKDGIFYTMLYPEIKIESSGNGGLIKRSMLGLKAIFVRQINQHFAQPEGGLLAGILFGEKSGLGQELENNFRRTGVIHIVVLSGFNVTIIALFIVWLFGLVVEPRIALLLSIVGIVLFAILVGAGPTILRASIMAVLAIIARILGRENSIVRALFIAGFLMVLFNPKILVFDISFQLSFLATLGIIYVSPILERRLGWVTNVLTIKETLIATLSAQVMVLPLLLYSIGEFSIVSPIVNILIIPFVPIAMLLGFLSSLFSLLWSPLAGLLMIPTYLILHMQIQIVSWFGNLPFASVTVPAFPVWVVALVYVLMFLIMYMPTKITHRQDVGG